MTDFTPEQIYEILRSGSPAEKDAFLTAAPDTSAKDTVRPLLTMNSPGFAVIGMNNLIMIYCHGLDPKFGAKLAKATYELAVELYLATSDHAGLDKTSLSIPALSYLHALNLMGNSDEVERASEEFIDFFTNTVPEEKNLSSIYMTRATALLNLNRIDEAQELLQRTDINWNPESSIERTRMLNQIKRLKNPVHALNEAEQQDSVPVIAEALQNMFDQGNTGSKVVSELVNRMHDENAFSPIKDKDRFQSFLNTLDTGERFLTQGSSGDNALTIGKRVRDATKIFYLTDQLNEPNIRHSITELEATLAWAKANQHNELLNDSLWGQYLCYSRLHDASTAADFLIALRLNIEKMRAGIKDIMRKGGAFSTYPNLFNVLCEKLYQSGRYPEMLESIAASKGRAVSDVLTREFTMEVDDAQMYSGVGLVPELTQQYHFNYLSFFIDEYERQSTIYSVFVDKSGRYHAFEPFTLDTTQLEQATMNLDPRKWGIPDIFDPGQSVPESNKILAPLSGALERLLKEGTLQQGDHLVISADNHLNNFPWYYLPIFDDYLVEYFSVSKMHNVLHLNTTLHKKLNIPSCFIGIALPKQDDLSKPEWSEFQNNLYKPLTGLENDLNLKRIQLLENEDASLDKLKNSLVNDALIHISTHGYFPGISSRHNPYHSSGFYLSDGTSLPTDKCAVSGECILTPQKVIEGKLKFNGCHVSLMACVSGLSREALGGDALGLDWALIQAGAASLLSTHWDVDAGVTAEFFKLFYRNWLKTGMSRAEACRQAALEIKNDNAAKTGKMAWAAFSLSGDWR